MKYQHFAKPNGDNICQTLLKLRNEYGDRWTTNMATYAISKIHKIPSLRWREPQVNGIPYTKTTFTII